MFLGKLFPHATVQQEFSRKEDVLINTAATAEYRTAASGRRQDGAVAAGGRRTELSKLNQASTC